MENTILVTGATGQYGTAVIQYLLRSGVPAQNIAALARHPERAILQLPQGIRILPGDYDDAHSLNRAFTGMDKILFVPCRDLGKRMIQHEHAVKAAKAAKVAHIIYPSFARKNETPASPLWMLGEAHLHMEEKRSGTYPQRLNNSGRR